MTIRRSLLDACRLARLPLPVSHDDLARTYALLDRHGITHNLVDTASYLPLLAEGRAAL